MLRSAALGAWFLGCTKPRSTHWLCEPQGQLQPLQRIGSLASSAHSLRPRASEISDIGFTSVCLPPQQLLSLTTAYIGTVFAAFNLLFIPVVYFLYPETANRTLEDIDEYFDVDSGHTTIIPFGDKATKSTARPQEALDAEVRRVTVADKKVAAHKSSVVHVEHVE